MQLIDNWKAVALKAWSSRLSWLAAVLSAAEVALPFFDGLLPVDRGVFAALALLVSSGAAVARLYAQPKTLPATPAQEPVSGT
jgi:hypothetical protein